MVGSGVALVHVLVGWLVDNSCFVCVLSLFNCVLLLDVFKGLL